MRIVCLIFALLMFPGLTARVDRLDAEGQAAKTVIDAGDLSTGYEMAALLPSPKSRAISFWFVELQGSALQNGCELEECFGVAE